MMTDHTRKAKHGGLVRCEEEEEEEKSASIHFFPQTQSGHDEDEPRKTIDDKKHRRRCPSFLVINKLEAPKPIPSKWCQEFFLSSPTCREKARSRYEQAPGISAKHIPDSLTLTLSFVASKVFPKTLFFFHFSFSSGKGPLCDEQTSGHHGPSTSWKEKTIRAPRSFDLMITLPYRNSSLRPRLPYRDT